MAGTILRLNGIHKHYGNKSILSNINLDVLSDDILGIIGPNGSGKSTLIKIMLGLVFPSAGTVSHRLIKPSEIRAVLDKPGFFPGFTLNKNLSLFTSVPDLRYKHAVTELPGIESWLSRPFGQCSAGIQKRCELAAALVHDPRLLILDEPTNGLDPTGVYEFRTAIRKVYAKGCPVVITSHALSELERICTRLCFLKQGRIQMVSTKETLLSRFSDLENAYRYFNLEKK